MNKIYLALAVAVACGSVQARDYPGQRDSRYERGVDRCVDDHTRGERLSRKEMKRVEEKCSRATPQAQAPIYSRGRESDRRRLKESERRGLSPAEMELQRSVSPGQTAP